MERLKLSVGAASASAPAQEVTAFTSATLRLSLFAGPSLSFSMPGLSPAALASSGLATDVWLYKVGSLWQRCRMMPVAQSWGPNGEDDVTINAVGYRQIIESRHIISGPPTYTATDQGAIVWGLVQHTQAQTNGDLGITSGVITTGVSRDRTEYRIGDNIGKLLGDLQKVENGPWWGIDANRVLTARLFSAFPTRTVSLVHGTNVRSAARTPSQASYANVAGAIGSATATTVAWATAPTLAADARGRWEAFDASHGTVLVQATVNAYAAGLLADRSRPPYSWTFDLDPAAYFEGDSNFDVGEFVPVVVPRSAVDELDTPPITVTVQVTEVSVTWDNAGSIQIKVSGVEV